MFVIIIICHGKTFERIMHFMQQRNESLSGLHFKELNGNCLTRLLIRRRSLAPCMPANGRIILSCFFRNDDIIIHCLLSNGSTMRLSLSLDLSEILFV